MGRGTRYSGLCLISILTETGEMVYAQADELRGVLEEDEQIEWQNLWLLAGSSPGGNGQMQLPGGEILFPDGLLSPRVALYRIVGSLMNI